MLLPSRARGGGVRRAPPSSALPSVARVEVTPEQFTLVQYDAGVIAGIAEELGIDISRPERGSDEEDARRAAERSF